ncbi:hypothetical protein AVEN_155811-1 [Araneus ventricosus]|uniref:Uncharacterized protein n=1 Tax=Araneus ventricosus TaxID=182803 RepID=A0A4Y2TWR4_ARAVE|nr:hypothetical protein AVEN_48605-1 [Araneus ventricosus]GBO04491.1 hypothetical protein AVEN_155811-1 [Araneus ventricosus]
MLNRRYNFYRFVIARFATESVSCTFKRDQTELADSLSAETIEASKRNVNTRWPICCITFDDVDVTEPPYGENPTMDSEEDYIKRMIPDKEMMKNVLDWINRCDFEKYDSYDDNCSDESTYYPSVTTCTDTSEAKVRKK